MRKFYVLFLTAFFACSPKDQTNLPLCEISLESTVNEALKNPLFQAGSWPKEQWWESFENETLTYMVRQALEHNPGYLGAKAQVEVLAQEANVVYANLFPTFNLDAASFVASLGKKSSPIASLTLPRSIHPTTIFFSLNYEFDFWGKNRQKLEAAMGQVKTQEALYAQSKLILSVSVVETYFDLQAVIEEQMIYEEILNDQKKLFALISLQVENGIANQITLNSVEENIIEIEKSMTVLEQEIALKKHALQQLMGRQVQENFQVPLIANSKAQFANLPEFIGSDLLARRPDIMAQIWQVRSAARLVGVAKTEFLPNINLGAGGGLFSFHKLSTSNSIVGFLLPSFELPIFTGGKLTANLKAKIASYHQLIQEYNNTVLLAIQQVADQVATFRSLHGRVEEQTKKVDLSYQNMALTALRVQVGVDPVTSYLQAKTLYLQDKLMLIDLQRGQMVSQVELVKALGGGYQTDEKNPSLCKE
jgi:NodT family efflux transporter outer membrane factor (OMF) lipoprotein